MNIKESLKKPSPSGRGLGEGLLGRSVAQAPSPNWRPSLSIHIERLILEGLPVTGSQTPMLQAAVEAELARLLAAEGLSSGLQAGGAVPSVKAGNIQMANDSSPSQLGRQIAQAVYGGISR